jgi:uncharacterized protein (DUF1800 family)
MSLALSLTVALPVGAASTASSAEEGARIVHALNRLGYGPRPGEVERVHKLGLGKWIELQLNPERIDDDDVAPRLASLRTLSLQPADLMQNYELPREAKKELQEKRAALGESPSEDEVRRARREFMQKYRGQMEGTPRQVLDELQAGKILRAVYSERQLDQVLVDFWLNHFNVFADKGPLKFLIGEYEQQAIRPHAWGHFEDLLKATAESPAMLFYLDNWLSADPGASPNAGGRQQAPGGLRGRRGGGFGGRRPHSEEETTRGRRPGGADQPLQQPGNRKRGLNENYAREIMELHTLGVDGGYTQKDVTEVARCFTGWTLRGLRQDKPGFAFDPRTHDRKDKLVLGQTIKASGKDEGDKVIHLLASHPATARFISTKLARRFVADEPPQALVDRTAEVFRKTNGEVRAVVRSLLTSPEFLAAANRGAKVKTPFEFVVSAVRASGAQVTDARDLARRIAAMGMPLYQQQPPTGYQDTADAWVSTSGLLARLNLALDLSAGRVRGVTADLGSLTPAGREPAQTTAALAAQLVPAGLSDATRRTIAGEAAAASPPSRIAGLVLGSPEFQRK